MRTLGLLLGLGLGLVLTWANSAEAACSGSGTDWSCPAGTSAAEVQSAVNSATDGATITFAPGAYTWASTIKLSNSKGITLQGAGIDTSVVTDGTNTMITLVYSGDNTKVYRITGFTFQNAPAGATALMFYGASTSTLSTLHSMRVDHNKFLNYDTKAIAIHFGEVTHIGKAHALIDHNTFTAPFNFMALKYMGTGNTDMWASSVRGTEQNLFLEDNTFDYADMTAGSAGSGCIDSWRAAAIVFRFNTTKNCLVATHGVVHGGVVNHETYRNMLERSTTAGGFWEQGQRLYHNQGSSETVVWGNTFKHNGKISITAIDLTHYRSADRVAAGYSTGPYARCDGFSTVSPVDGKIGAYGYPCWMQPGRAPAGGSPAYGTLSPVYTWQNVDYSTGNKVPLNIADLWPGPPLVSDHIKPDRDYYDAVSKDAQTSPTSPFDGTTGTGFGTLANRPTTCTTNTNEGGGGVGYWATDQGAWNKLPGGEQGVLYRCAATNTWVSHYTPYTYPHPLQAGGGTGNSPPAAPTNLSVR